MSALLLDRSRLPAVVAGRMDGTVLVACAICDVQAPSVRYAELWELNNPGAVLTHPDLSPVPPDGWGRGKLGELFYFFCPLHARHRVEDVELRYRHKQQRKAALEALTRAWDLAHPVPLPSWRNGWGKASP